MCLHHRRGFNQTHKDLSTFDRRSQRRPNRHQNSTWWCTEVVRLCRRGGVSDGSAGGCWRLLRRQTNEARVRVPKNCQRIGPIGLY
ncbi:hypothetical protein ERO13_A01G041000v2 [Gossypium hirsutum]|nr:hypothetical protein ERO13_A01G041000v2 [Gossypium hirsutum]